jgi:ABC-type branched-subunit amino acid transport system substrate-binding protein
VVLPLSGPFARIGEQSLLGVLLAAGVFAPPGDFGANVRVVVRDSAGSPARAQAAVRELAELDYVSAIVGPLLSSECEAAAEAAESAGIPLLTLTAREEIARDRPHVFRLRTRPVEETQLLVDRARAAGASRFAILYRDDAYGRGLRGLFWDAVEERGGRVVGVASYDPQATDFAEPIRRLAGYTLLDHEEKKLIAEREEMMQRARRVSAEEALELRQRAEEMVTQDGSPLPPIVDFDVLFIPESYENVVLIAPQLAFHEVTGARLLGSDGWYHEELVRLGREHVNGALFTAHFYPRSHIPYVQRFAARFEEAFGRQPGAFEALAYDATNLILAQMARGRHRRESLRKGVLATDAYPGVSGVISVGPDGNAQKRPYLLGVERGRVVHYDD